MIAMNVAMNVIRANRILKIMNAGVFPGQLLIDEAAANYLKDAEDLFSKMIKPVTDHLEKAKTFAKASDGLAGLIKKVKTAELETVITQLSFMSEVTGSEVVKNLELGKKPKAVMNISKDDLIQALELCFDKSPEQAVEYLIGQGITLSGDWEETLAAVKAHSFTVAKAANADVVQMFKDEIVKALDEGIVFADWKQNIETTLKTNGYLNRTDSSAYRLDVIYRMNMQNAYMRGRYLEQKEVVEDYPYWEFVATLDNRTTEGCRGLNGVVLPSDDGFWSVNYPMRHFQCRSTIRTLSDFSLKKRGLKVNKPTELVEIDGNKVKLKDVQPAKGFDVTPDAIWKPDMSKYDADVKQALKDELK